MAKRPKKWLEIERRRHGIIWWLIIGWWERPIAFILWYVLAGLTGFKGVKYIYRE